MTILHEIGGVFQQVVSMSLTASLVILAICGARLLLRQAPKKFSYWLWAGAAFRLVCPFSFPAAFSLLALAPAAQTVAETGPLTEVSYLPGAGLPEAAPGVGAADAVLPQAAGAGQALGLWEVLGLVWLLGAVALVVGALAAYLRVKGQVTTAVKFAHNVYECGAFRSPFVLGFFRPKIYIPFGLEPRQREHVLCHESAHIQRRDYLIKPLGFLLLAIHWFNPLVWLAFTLAGRDMEASCDEAVLRRTAGDIRAEYAQSILRLAAGRPSPATPLAFGAGDAKDRIRTVLCWKKPARWMTALGAAAAALVIGALAVNPASGDPMGYAYQVTETLYADQRYSFSYTEETAPQYSVTGTGELLSRAPSEDEWTYLGELTEISWSRERRYALFDTLTCRAQEAMDQVARMWRLDTFDQNGTLYLLMETRRGAALLGVGYDRPEGESIRWLFRLRADGEPAEVPAGAGEWTASGSFAYVLQPGEQAVSERPVVLTEEAPDFCYQTTWSLGSMAVQVGLAAEDGTEYLFRLSTSTHHDQSGGTLCTPRGLYCGYGVDTLKEIYSHAVELTDFQSDAYDACYVYEPGGDAGCKHIAFYVADGAVASIEIEDLRDGRLLE